MFVFFEVDVVVGRDEWGCCFCVEYSGGFEFCVDGWMLRKLERFIFFCWVGIRYVYVSFLLRVLILDFLEFGDSYLFFKVYKLV